MSAAANSVVLAIANHKGGVGKTSTAMNLACAFAGTRRSVLLVDLDPQGSATVSMLRERPTSFISSGNALIQGTSLVPCIKHFPQLRFDLLPASDDLTAFCVNKHSSPHKELLLRAAFAPLRQIYDVIIIDCPPALNLLTINALCAADELIIPLSCEFFAVEGLGSLLRLFERLKIEGKSKVHFMGIVRTLFDKGETLSQKISQDLKLSFGPLIFTTIIPYTSRISEAPSIGRPVILYDKSSIGARAYLSLAGEILTRLDQLPSTTPHPQQAQDVAVKSKAVSAGTYVTSPIPRAHTFSGDAVQAQRLGEKMAETAAEVAAAIRRIRANKPEVHTTELVLSAFRHVQAQVNAVAAADGTLEADLSAATPLWQPQAAAAAPMQTPVQASAMAAAVAIPAESVAAVAAVAERAPAPQSEVETASTVTSKVQPPVTDTAPATEPVAVAEHGSARADALEQELQAQLQALSQLKVGITATRSATASPVASVDNDLNAVPEESGAGQSVAVTTPNPVPVKAPVAPLQPPAPQVEPIATAASAPEQVVTPNAPEIASDPVQDDTEDVHSPQVVKARLQRLLTQVQAKQQRASLPPEISAAQAAAANAAAAAILQRPESVVLRPEVPREVAEALTPAAESISPDFTAGHVELVGTDQEELRPEVAATAPLTEPVPLTAPVSVPEVAPLTAASAAATATAPAPEMSAPLNSAVWAAAATENASTVERVERVESGESEIDFSADQLLQEVADMPGERAENLAPQWSGEHFASQAAEAALQAVLADMMSMALSEDLNVGTGDSDFDAVADAVTATTVTTKAEPVRNPVPVSGVEKQAQAALKATTQAAAARLQNAAPENPEL